MLFKRFNARRRITSILRNQNGKCITYKEIESWWSVLSDLVNDLSILYGTESEIVVMNVNSDSSIMFKKEVKGLLDYVNNDNEFGKYVAVFSSDGKLLDYYVVFAQNVLNTNTDFDNEVNKNNGIIRIKR